MTRSEAATYRAAQLDKARAIMRAQSDREYCVATLIGGAARRGSSLTWFEVVSS